MKARFSPEEAIPIALALLVSHYCQSGRHRPAFLAFLMEQAQWVEQVTHLKSKNRFRLKPMHAKIFQDFMTRHYGENWKTSLEKLRQKRIFSNWRGHLVQHGWMMSPTVKSQKKSLSGRSKLKNA